MANFKNSIDLLFTKKYLLYTNVALGGTFLCAGDVLEQLLNKRFNKSSIEKVDTDQLKEKLRIQNSQIDTNRAGKFIVLVWNCFD